MTAPWAVSCPYWWVAVAETRNEAAELVEAHAQGVKAIMGHAITIKGGKDSLSTAGGGVRPRVGLRSDLRHQFEHSASPSRRAPGQGSTPSCRAMIGRQQPTQRARPSRTWG